MSCHIHQIPGRLHVRAAAFKRNPDRIDAAQAAIARLGGIENMRGNPLTGSIIITFDRTSITAEQILDALHNAGYVDMTAAVPVAPAARSRPAPSRLESSHLRYAGKIFASALLEKAVERSATALIAALI